MKKASTVIVDDERKNVKTLEHFITSYCPQLDIVGTAFTKEEAIEVINSTEPDLIFMDIMLKAGTGFDVLDAIEHKEFKVIFATGHDTFALKAFEYNAIDYLLKPLSLEKLIKAVNKAYEDIERKWFTTREQLTSLKGSMINKNHFNFIAIPSWDKIEFVKIEDIVYLKSDGRYTMFHLADGKTILASKNIGEYEEMVDESQFFRIHKSYIVNLKHIVKIYKEDGNYCEMTSRETIPIAKRRQDSLSRLLKIRP